MNTSVAFQREPEQTAESPIQPGIHEAIARACHRIAPLWPLRHFVAVNPFLGFTEQTFAATCTTLRRVARVEMLAPRAFYREALAAGRIMDADLTAALAAAPQDWDSPLTVAALKQALSREPNAALQSSAVVATVAEVLDRLAAGDRQTSRTSFMIDEISKFCAAYFDEGQASWRMPWRNLRPYAAWRAMMRYDLNPAAMGIIGFRDTIARLPEDPVAAIGAVIDGLGIPSRAIEDYLYRALFDIGGWAAYARYRVWDQALFGRNDDTLVHLLAIRLAWGYALFTQRTDPQFREAWQQATQAAATMPMDEQLGHDPDMAVDLLMQLAYEIAYQRRLLQMIAANGRNGSAPRPEPERRQLQAAFCIDVRSEAFRRALEATCPDVETIGFAGFFGFPIEYVPIGHTRGSAQCPVLLKPSFVVCEAVDRADDNEETEILGLRLLRRRATKAWKAFKVSAVSSFTYVETMGLLFFGKLLSDSAGLTRTVSDPNIDGLDGDVIARVGPRLAPRIVGERMTGFNAEQRVDMAEAVLHAMSLTRNFARLVLLAGHGSTTVNNPHASSLDCGACGGHSGEANARVAAAILNDPEVRVGLGRRGVHVPSDTWFIAGLHDTTTDDVALFDVDEVPASHTQELKQLRGWLGQSSALARLERAPGLGLKSTQSAHQQILKRSREWSQVRPEWGLAGNAAFIAAPRQRTAGVDLGGRAFLHSYDWLLDHDGSVLELIMTAPMVVASWINLQYYGSTVNNRVFGSGNKALHNVVGTLGVLEGNAGDLKVGLPWQSLHDGQRFVHEPLRLTALIEAPRERLQTVIDKHESVRQLVDNQWLSLFAIEQDGRRFARYCGQGAWRDELPSIHTSTETER